MALRKAAAEGRVLATKFGAKELREIMRDASENSPNPKPVDKEVF
jgi:hypothetical protein